MIVAVGQCFISLLLNPEKSVIVIVSDDDKHLLSEKQFNSAGLNGEGIALFLSPPTEVDIFIVSFSGDVRVRPRDLLIRSALLYLVSP